MQKIHFMNPGVLCWAQWRRWLVRALIPVLLIQSVAAQLPAPSSTPLPDLGDPAQASLTPAQERRIAEEIMREVRFREPTYLNDPEVEEYLVQNKRGKVRAGNVSLAGSLFVGPVAGYLDP